MKEEFPLPDPNEANPQGSTSEHEQLNAVQAAGILLDVARQIVSLQVIQHIQDRGGSNSVDAHTYLHKVSEIREAIRQLLRQVETVVIQLTASAQQDVLDTYEQEKRANSNLPLILIGIWNALAAIGTEAGGGVGMFLAEDLHRSFTSVLEHFEKALTIHGGRLNTRALLQFQEECNKLMRKLGDYKA